MSDKGAPRDEQEYRYRITGEPTNYDAPADFDRQYDLVYQKLESERARTDSLDIKIAAVLAATIAGIGFSLGHVSNRAELLSISAFAIPLLLLYFAYRPIQFKDAPSGSEMAFKYPWFPEKTLASAAVAMGKAVEHNFTKIEKKANYFNRAFISAILAICIVGAVKAATYLSTGVYDDGRRSSETQRTVATCSTAAPGATHARVANPGSKQGGKTQVN